MKLLAGSSSNCFEFLGYTVDLSTGKIGDSLLNVAEIENSAFQMLNTLLIHYSQAVPVESVGKLVKFAGLPGGRAYEKAFLDRAVKPIADVFGNNPNMLLKCAAKLGGCSRTYGDCSVELFGLPRIPLTIILWKESEFPAEANMLFDESASQYLPTEDLAVLGELTTVRIIEAFKLTS